MKIIPSVIDAFFKRGVLGAIILVVTEYVIFALKPSGWPAWAWHIGLLTGWVFYVAVCSLLIYRSKEALSDIAELEGEKEKAKREIALYRKVCTYVRKIVEHRIVKIDAVRSEVKKSTAYQETLRVFSSCIDFEDAIGDLLEAIYQITVANNKGDFSVCLMEVQKDQLKIPSAKFYKNVSDEPPYMFVENNGIEKGWGIAGTAWSIGDLVICENAYDDTRYKWRSFQRRESPKFNSLACMPIELKTRDHSNGIVGILCVSSAKQDFFNDSKAQRENLLRRIDPFIKMISQSFCERNLLRDLEHKQLIMKERRETWQNQLEDWKNG